MTRRCFCFSNGLKIVGVVSRAAVTQNWVSVTSFKYQPGSFVTPEVTSDSKDSNNGDKLTADVTSNQVLGTKNSDSLKRTRFKLSVLIRS